MGEFGGMTGQKATYENHNSLWEERWKAEARAARALEAFKLKDEEIETLQKQIAGFKVWDFLYSCNNLLWSVVNRLFEKLQKASN